MNVYQSSVLEDDEPSGNTSDQDKPDHNDGVIPPFQKILDLAVDPVIESAIMKSEEKKKLRPRWDARVYVVNCLTYLQVGVVVCSATHRYTLMLVRSRFVGRAGTICGIHEAEATGYPEGFGAEGSGDC